MHLVNPAKSQDRPHCYAPLQHVVGWEKCKTGPLPAVTGPIGCLQNEIPHLDTHYDSAPTFIRPYSLLLHHAFDQPKFRRECRCFALSLCNLTQSPLETATNLSNHLLGACSEGILDIESLTTGVPVRAQVPIIYAKDLQNLEKNLMLRPSESLWVRTVTPSEDVMCGVKKLGDCVISCEVGHEVLVVIFLRSSTPQTMLKEC